MDFKDIPSEIKKRNEKIKEGKYMIDNYVFTYEEKIIIEKTILQLQTEILRLREIAK
jgi:hypothetical protein